jgi:septum formation protein
MVGVPRPLVLASRSPQRRAILTQLGLPFRVAEPAYEELPLPLPPEELVQAYSRGKARSVEAGPADGPVLGVDTEVAVDGRVYGKPADEQAAREMLAELAGRDHLVVSGLTLLADGQEQTGLSITMVRFRPLGADEIDGYVATGEWEGRAGGYAIQGRGAALVERIEGDYFNVVGLPVALLVTFLRAAGNPCGG